MSRFQWPRVVLAAGKNALLIAGDDLGDLDL